MGTCVQGSVPAGPPHLLSVCPGLRDLVATQLSMGRLNGCCTLVRMILKGGRKASREKRVKQDPWLPQIQLLF